MTAAATQSPSFVSYADYCRLEADSEQRHDYVHGKVVPVPGGSINHSRICVNFGREISTRLMDELCEFLDSNFRIAFPDHTYSHYTDGMIVCGKAKIDPGDPTGQSLTNPTTVIEVQSPSTGKFDRTTKFDRYRALASFREYVIVFQDKPEVQTYFRQDDGTWLFSAHAGLDGHVPLHSVGLSLPMSGIYARVEFPDVPFDEPSPDGR